LIKILTGFVLDLIFGDPYHFPHPVRFIGNFTNKLENVLLQLKHKKLAGFVLTFIVVVSTYLITLCLCSLNIIIEILLIYTIFAVKSLSFEGNKIYKLLKENNISEARKQLSFIVSRETTNLDEKNIIRSTIESISENIVDGIISPIIFLFLGGAPLAMAYKAASTLDSMIGYKNEKYKDFGFASAKFDDILNFIPARITGFFLIPIASFFCGKNIINSIKITIRDRLKHDSPNSAHSEAAVAGALGLQLGGPGIYFGKVEEKPVLGNKLKEFEQNDIKDTIKILYVTTILCLISGFIIKFFLAGVF
jgi:adenosylcobinamide-phosphate synthase